MTCDKQMHIAILAGAFDWHQGTKLLVMNSLLLFSDILSEFRGCSKYHVAIVFDYQN